MPLILQFACPEMGRQRAVLAVPFRGKNGENEGIRII
jgi:hypothetical protein